MTFTDLFIGEGWLHIKFNSKHRSPGSEMLEQGFGARSLADHHTAPCLGAMGPADQLKALEAVRFSTSGHVVDQFGVSGFLPFDLRELPGHVVKLHRMKAVQAPC